jgi:PucR C-terminal helix-turn-helix domain
MPGDAMAAVLRELAADVRTVDALVAAARSASPEVARLPAAENRRHAALLLAAVVAAFERPGEPDLAAADRLGADRAAQGVPVGAVLCGVRAGRARALELAVERGRAAGVPDAALVCFLLDLDRYAGALDRRVLDGYQAAERELAGSRSQARLLRALLLGGGAGPDDPARAGLRRDGRYHCLVTDVSDPARMRALEHQLAGCGGAVAAVQGRLAGVVARPPATGALDPAALVVVAPARPLGQAPAVYELCGAALRAAAGRGLRGVRQLVDLAGETALAAQPLLGELLGDAVLGALRRGDDFHRQLAATAFAYLDHGARLDQTAAALHVHPNTVRYRLRRLHEVTGLPAVTAEPGPAPTVPETLHLWWALRAWLDRPGAADVDA